MPSKGAWWQVGGLNNKVIEEADLTDALQTKVNNIGGGTGNAEILLDTTFGDNLTTHSFNLSRSVALDGTDVGELIIIFSELALSGSDIIDIGYNGSIITNGDTVGYSSNGGTVSAVNSQGCSDGINFNTVSGAIKISIPGGLGQGGGNAGIFARWGDTSHYSAGSFNPATSDIFPLVSIQIGTRGGVQTLNSVSRVVVYAVNKD